MEYFILHSCVWDVWLNTHVFKHAIFYMVSLFTTSLTPSGDANFFHQPLPGRGPPCSLHWWNSGTGSRRWGEYTCWWSFPWNTPRWSSDVVVTVMVEGSKTHHLLRLYKIPKRKVPFMEGTYFRTFLWRRFWSSKHVFSLSATRVCS